MTYDPPAPRLGDLTIIYVEDTDVSVDRGFVQIFGYEMPLFRVSAGKLRGVIPVPVDILPRRHPAAVFVGERVMKSELEVVDRTFRTSALRVSKRFTKKKSKALRARLKREATAMAELWEADPTFPMNVGQVQVPVKGRRTSGFGTKRVFNGVTKTTHWGLDLDGEIGEPITAAASGVVVMSAMRWKSGGTIVIDHGGGLFSMYFHMSKRHRKIGDFVKKGERIGLVGKTGRVTGPHLHLALVVRAVYLFGDKKGEPRSMYVDPEPFLQLDFEGHPAFFRNADGIVRAEAAQP